MYERVDRFAFCPVTLKFNFSQEFATVMYGTVVYSSKEINEQNENGTQIFLLGMQIGRILISEFLNFI